MNHRFFSSWMFTALRQDQVNGLKKQFKLSDEQITLCNSYDPSPKDTYTGWLCKIYSKTNGTDEEKEAAIQKLQTPLMQFMKLVNSPDFPKDRKDIGKYTVPELLNMVGNQRRYLKNLSPGAIEKLVKTEGLPGAKIIWDGGGFRMWYVTNPEYAMILGSNTGWCTANKHHADSYTLRDGLYTIYKEGKPFLQGHVYFNRGSSEIEFLDVKDNPPSILSSDVIRALETIDHPIMLMFKERCASKLEYTLRQMNSEEVETHAKKIIEFANKNEWEEAHRVSHTLKGVSGNIGADRLFECSTLLDDGCKNQDMKLVEKHSVQCQKALDEVIEFINSSARSV